jgi:hypothetical protein
MRDRLIALLNFVQCKAECCGALDGGRCGELDHLDRCQIETIADHLLANGVIVPPCKVGDRLYEIVEMPKHTFVSEFPIIVEPQQIIYKNIMWHHSCIPFDDFGKTVFLTREEAEKALAERSGE